MVLALILTGVLLSADAVPQIGGNGADGPLVPTSDVTLETSANGGIFNFTTIQIPAGVKVSLRGTNPAVLLSQGVVDVQGILEAAAETVRAYTAGAPGAGGWYGGSGGYTFGFPGQGPGGGYGGFHSPGGSAAHATAYGSAFPFDLQGGSGGGGAGVFPTASFSPLNGGHGGGALAILADGALTISGDVSARGGDVVAAQSPFVTEIPGGAGSGGAILLRALGPVRVSGRISATGGKQVSVLGTIGQGDDGFVRIDAYATPPDVTGAVIAPAPLLAELPHLRELTPMALGQVWQPRCAAVPGDTLAWFMSTRTLTTPLMLTIGTLHLDPNPGGGLVFVGFLATPTTGIDPLAASNFTVPNAPQLVNLPFHTQMLSFVTATGRPWLSNLLTSVVRP